MSRTLFAVGRNETVQELARQCAWCRGFFSDRDARLYDQGAPLTHGICATCHTEQLESDPAIVSLTERYQRKAAAKLAAYFVAQFGTDDAAIACVQYMDDTLRRQVAFGLDLDPPSEVTWGFVVERLRELAGFRPSA